MTSHIDKESPTWPYELFAQTLQAGIDAQRVAYNEFLAGRPGLVGDQPADPQSDQSERMEASSRNVGRIDTLFTPDGVMAAFGRPEVNGEPGVPSNETKIIELASTLVSIYDGILDSARQTLACQVPPPYNEIYPAIANFSRGPLREIQEFSTLFATTTEKIKKDLLAGKTPSVQLTLSLSISIDDADMTHFNSIMDRLTPKKKRGFFRR
jgi:hypothetical protein